MKLVNEILKELQDLEDAFSSKTLLKQLGGGKFMAMTGAKDLVQGDNTLMMKLGKNAGKVTKVRFTLKNDLYDIEFMNIRKVKGELRVKMIKKVTGVDAEQLQDIFTDVTKLRLSL
jgi:hypothetical protein